MVFPVWLTRTEYSPLKVHWQGSDAAAAGPSPDVGQGWGLGFVVRTEQGKNPLPGSVGEYYWNGAFGTAFWVDPK